MNLHKMKKADLVREIKDLKGRIIALEESSLRQDNIVRKTSLQANIADNSMDAVMALTVTGSIISWNRSAEKLFGYTFADVYGQNVSMLLPVDEQENLWKNQKKVLLSGLGERIEVACFRKKGASFPAIFSISPIFNNTRAAIGVSVIIRDMTEAKRMQDNIRIISEVRAALLKLYEMHDEPLGAIIDFVVEECQKISGSELAFIGFVNETETVMDTHVWSRKAMDECRVAGEKPTVFPLEGSGLWGDTVRRREAIIVNDCAEDDNLSKKGYPGGHLPIARFMGIPLLDKDRVVLMAGLANKGIPYDESDAAHISLMLEGVWNFMQRRRAEAAAGRMAARYAVLFENANDAILLLKKGRLVDCNRKTLELFDCDKEGIIGKTPFDLSPPFQPDGDDSHRKALEKIKLALSGEPQTFAWQHRKADGSVFDTEVGLNAVTLDDGVHLQAVVHDITRWKQMVQNLTRAEKKYREIFENARDGIIQTTADGKIINVNPFCARILGYSSARELMDQVVSVGEQLYVNKEDRDRLVSRTLKDGIVEMEEVQWFKKDGTPVWLCMNGRAVRDQEEGNIFFEAILRDITESKKAEEELKRSFEKLSEAEEVLSAAINASLETLTVLDRDGTVLLCNTTVAERLGTSVAQLLHTCLYDHFPPDVAAARRERYDRVFATGQPVRFEDIRADRYYDQHVYPIFDEQGEVSRVVVYANDITERRLVEEALLKSEEEYRNIYDNAMVGIFQSTPEGRYLRVNNALASIHGFSSPKEMAETVTRIGEQLYVDPQDRQRYMDLLRKDDKIRGYEAQLYRKDGSTVWISMNVRAVRNPDGSTVRYEGIVEDISKRKQAEQALKRDEARFESLLKIVEHEADSMQEFLDFALEEAIALTESRIGYIYFYDEKTKLFTLNTRSREVAGQCRIKNPQTVYDLDRTGIWGEAVRQRRPIILNDFAAPHPLKKGQPEGHTPLERFMTIPVFDGPRIVAVVGVANKLSSYDDTDIRQLRLLMSSVWKNVDRRRVQDTLRESEERYRSIFENAVEGIYQSTPEGRYLTVNPAVASILGYSSPAEVTSAITDIGTQVYANSEDRARLTKEMHEHGSVKQFEFPALTKTGQRIWLSNHVRAVKSDAGNVLYYEGTMEDITRIKKGEEDLKASADKLRKSLAGTIEVISMMLETRDPYTAGHQRRVSKLARSIAQEMGLPGDVVDTIRMAANIHDIGKMSVPAEILAKPTKLSNVEMEFMKMHPRTGYDILKVVDLPAPVAEIILQHHEKYDGSGYPQGLKNGEILLEAQIITVADVVEAMASHRPYRPALGIDAALEEIARKRGILYHPDATDACLAVFREQGFRFDADEGDGRPCTPVVRALEGA